MSYCSTSLKSLVPLILLVVTAILFGCGGSDSNSANRVFVYVASDNSQTISGYVSDKTTGALKAMNGAPFSAGVQATAERKPLQLAMDPQNQFLFVLGSELAVFAIDPTTGALSQTRGSTYSFSGTGRSIAVDGSGRLLYVSTDGGGIWGWKINRENKSLAVVPGSPFGHAPDVITIDPNDKYLYAAGPTLGLQVYSIDGGTGALTAVGAPIMLNNSYAPVAITIHPSGRFAYVAAQPAAMSPDLFSMKVDSITGAVSEAFHVGYSYWNPTISLDGKWLFSNPQISSEYSIDSVTGALTQLTSPQFGPLGTALAVQSDSKMVYVVSNGSTGSEKGTISVYSIDSNTGATVRLSGSPYATDVGPVDVAVTY